MQNPKERTSLSRLERNKSKKKDSVEGSHLGFIGQGMLRAVGHEMMQQVIDYVKSLFQG